MDSDTREISYSVPQPAMDEIYIAMCDARDRLDTGTDLLTRCIGYLNERFRYEPPTGSQNRHDLQSQQEKKE